MTVGLEKIITDAMATGMIVTRNSYCAIIKKSPRGVGITIWDDGTATRNDVRLDLAQTIHTQKAMRLILGI